jgi:hypothetical protein
MSVINGLPLIKKYESGVEMTPDETQLVLAALYFWYRKANENHEVDSVGRLMVKVQNETVFRCAKIVAERAKVSRGMLAAGSINSEMWDHRADANETAVTAILKEFGLEGK